MLRKRKRKRNPEFEEIAKEILSEVDGWEYLSEGAQGEIYYFYINSSLIINNIKLMKGSYVLKILKREQTKEKIDRLKKLSKLELIPEIYFIDKKIIIMKYINADSLDYLINNDKLSSYNKRLKIFNNLKEIIKNYHSHNMIHGDLDYGNILVDRNNKVYLIDPGYPEYFDPNVDLYYVKNIERFFLL